MGAALVVHLRLEFAFAYPFLGKFCQDTVSLRQRQVDVFAHDREGDHQRRMPVGDVAEGGVDPVREPKLLANALAEPVLGLKSISRHYRWCACRPKKDGLDCLVRQSSRLK